MQYFLLLLFLLPGVGMLAQGKDKQAVKYAATISTEDLHRHLFIVAGPDMLGRETATEGQRRAAAYIENHFRQLGLAGPVDNGYQQVYSIYRDSVTKASLQINGRNYEPGTDFFMQAGNFPFSMKTGEVVFAGYGIDDSTRNDYQGIDARGKVVLVLSGLPPSMPRNYVNKAAFAAKNGAAAVLEVQPNFSPRMMGRGAGAAYLDAYPKTIPPNRCLVKPALAEAITGLSYDALVSAAANPGAARIFPARLGMEFQKSTGNITSSNVLGFLEGTDLKDEVIVISAHYDHLGMRDSTIYYGADDDGSGTVSVLEIAEAFAQAKKAGKGPRRSILFMTVSGEEKGLWGSEYYTNNPIFPIANTVCDLNIDMVGRVGREYQGKADSANYVYVIGDDKLSSELRPISEAANATYTDLKLDYKYNDPNDPNRFYYRSDHYNFAEKGVPIIFYFNGTHADYHRPTDTPDKINYPLMAKRAQLVFYTAWEIANRDGRVRADKPVE